MKKTLLKSRVYCSYRSESHCCDFSSTFLDIYESQIEWYLTDFVIPDDCQKKILRCTKGWLKLMIKAGIPEISD